MANSTLALLTQLRLKQPDIWGWSLGGSVAYALLAYHGGEAVSSCQRLHAVVERGRGVTRFTAVEV